MPNLNLVTGQVIVFGDLGVFVGFEGYQIASVVFLVARYRLGSLGRYRGEVLKVTPGHNIHHSIALFTAYTGRKEGIIFF